MRSPRHATRLTVWIGLWVVLPIAVLSLIGLASVADAQDSNATLSDMALHWADGEFGSPLICQIDGRPTRGLRRISIAPPRLRTRPPVARISFADLEIDEASRCFTELAGDVPNVLGWVDIRLKGKHRSDTARRDFREALRRKRGFEYEIAGGSLRIQPVTQPTSEPKLVRFSRGTARLTQVPAGSDSAKLLATFPGTRKLLLELEAKDGTKLRFPLYVPELD